VTGADGLYQESNWYSRQESKKASLEIHYNRQEVISSVHGGVIVEMLGEGGGESGDGRGARRIMWHTSVSPQDAVDVAESWGVLAIYASRLL
jgi:hypothetical protein